MKDSRINLIEVPEKGEALVITDLHGNLDDYRKYESIWKLWDLNESHVIITGDFIHPAGYYFDGSIEILESLMDYHQNYQNFHVLLGNHEWCQLISQPIYKLGVDQAWDFQRKVQKRFTDFYKDKLREYNKFFRELPIAMKTDNRILVSHAGPSTFVKSIDDLIKINTETFNPILDDMLWRPHYDFAAEDIHSFLNRIECNVHIVGHTPVNGFKITGEKCSYYRPVIVLEGKH